MSESQHSYDSLDVVLFLISLAVVTLGLIGGGILFSMMLFGFFSDNGQEVQLAITNLTSFGAMCLCSVPLAYSTGRALLGHRPPTSAATSPAWFMTAILFPLSLGLGHLAYERNVLASFLGPIAHLSAAAIPVIIAVAIVCSRGPRISPRRLWGQFLAGVWATPVLSLAIEIGLLIVVLLIIIMGLTGTPSGREIIQRFIQTDAWTSASAYDNLMLLVQQPWAIIQLLGFIVLLVPLVEEVLKTIAIWPLLGRRLSPSEAFLSGVLGGAGYALVEALFLTQPGPDWTATMFARSGATLMHAFTAGLSCWGIAQLIQQRQLRNFVGALLSAVTMHAAWNVVAVGIGVVSFAGELQQDILPPGTMSMMAVVAVAVLILLSVLALTGLIRVPKLLTKQAAPASASE
jgi:RsiW-degrading membrane proteinase PrsW (M82 family)